MSLLARLPAIEELPTLPESILRVQALVCSDDGDAATLASIIEEDPALAAKLLKIANSSFYGQPHKRISSVKVAVTRLGFDEVWSISMAMSMIKHFSSRRSSLGYLNFWKHSVDAAYLMAPIADACSVSFDDAERQDLFLAGLFHDIGMLIFDQFFPEVFEKIMERSLVDEISFLTAEQIVAGKETHPVIGGALLELWKLRPALSMAVRYHHSPEKGPEQSKKLAIPLSVAEFILCNGRIGSFEGTVDILNKEDWASFGITAEVLQHLFQVAEEQVIKSDTLLSISRADLKSPLQTI